MEVRVGAGLPEVTSEKAVPMRSLESRHPHVPWALTWVGAQPGTRVNLKMTLKVCAHINSAETDLGLNL